MGDYRIDMGTESKMRVDSHSRHAGCPLIGHKELFRVDVSRSVRLCELKSEQSDGGFRSRYGDSPFVRPHPNI